MKRVLGLITATILLAAAAPPMGMYPPGKFDVPVVPSGDDIVLSNVTRDAAVPTGLSFLWPITGDDNRNATATLEYKETSSGTWIRAMDLVRVEPQYDQIQSGTTGEIFSNTPPSFVGIITGLTPETDYDIRVVADDPDGVSGQPATQIILASTPEIPPTSGNPFSIVRPGTEQEIIDELAAAVPGRIIRIDDGTYNFTSPLTLNVDGTEAQPITIEGQTRTGVVLDWNSVGTQLSIGIQLRCNHCVLRNITIQDVETGVQIYGGSSEPVVENVSVRDTLIRNVVDAISAIWAPNRIYVADNVLEGNRPQGVDDGGGKGSGIEVVGTNIEILNNTISGFRDSFGTSNVQAIATAGVFAHNNLVLWGSDDGYEFDFCSRSCAAYDNLLANVAQGLSFQPSYDGPTYAFRNIIYNANRGPLKLNSVGNSDTFGGRIFHNTFIKAGSGWENFGADPGDFWIKNNLFIGQGAPVRDLHITSVFSRTEFNYNGWFQDLDMLFTTSEFGNHFGNDFAEWVAEGATRGGNGVNDTLLLGETVFANVTLDFDVNDWTVYRDPLAAGLDFRADAGSSSVDAGVVIPGFTEQYGNFPDLGAFPNYQMAVPTYGAPY